MKKKFLTTLVALAIQTGAVSAEVKNPEKGEGTPAFLYGTATYYEAGQTSTGAPVPRDKSVLVVDSNTQETLHTFVIGENSSGEPISAGWYATNISDNHKETLVKFLQSNGRSISAIANGDTLNDYLITDVDNIDLLFDQSAESNVPETSKLSYFTLGPNPMNPSTNFNIGLIEEGNINLAIYDIAGKKVKTLVSNDFYNQGDHRIKWNGENDKGLKVSSGVYFAKIDGDVKTITRKVTVVK